MQKHTVYLKLQTVCLKSYYFSNFTTASFAGTKYSTFAWAKSPASASSANFKSIGSFPSTGSFTAAATSSILLAPLQYLNYYFQNKL